MTTAPIRVVLVEDSPTQRAFLRRSLEADGDIVVVGEAQTASSAIAVVTRGRPDVVTLDLEIPGGGHAAIEGIMESSPRPILLLSGMIKGPRSTAARQALRAGAAGVLAKPDVWDLAAERTLRGRVRALRGAWLRAPRQRNELDRPVAAGGPPPIVAIAASTGGPAALSRLLRDLGGLPAPVLVVQHIRPDAIAGLADWLTRTTGWSVGIATPGGLPLPGTALIAPPRLHLGLDGRGRIELVDDPAAAVWPSADHLFASLARHHARRTVAVVLTGMGSDGATGLARLRRAGATTLAQDEESSAVFGMAKAAAARGAVERLVPLPAMATAVRRAVEAVA